jgi:pantothenate kinase
MLKERVERIQSRVNQRRRSLHKFRNPVINIAFVFATSNRATTVVTTVPTPSTNATKNIIYLGIKVKEDVIFVSSKVS